MNESPCGGKQKTRVSTRTAIRRLRKMLSWNIFPVKVKSKMALVNPERLI